MHSPDDLLFQVLDRPAAEWEAALADLCARHESLAPELRQRFALLQGAGLTTPAPGGLPLLAADMPEWFGPYRLQRRLGGGGMGVVYLARHEELGRNVALKLVRPELLYFDGARARFAREVEAVARLEHPGCVQVHQVGEAKGIPYFAMELIGGVSFESLLQWVRSRVTDPMALSKLSGRILVDALREQGTNQVETAANDLFSTTWPRVCVRLCLAAAEALAHAHGRGVVHRDVKPSNLMLTAEGRVVVIDFGLAVAEGASRMTRTGAFLGSLPYMAPEQVRGDVNAVDARTDVYALGVCLYELLTLVSPFDSGKAEATRRRIEAGQVTPMRNHNSAIDIDMATVCARAMEADPAVRYQTMHALAADLAAWLDHRPVTARPTSIWRQTVRWVKRRPGWAVALALLLGVLLFGPLVVSLAVAGQRDRALAAERLARRREYSANLVAANMALGAGKSSEALRRLRACPEDLRGFEWRHLDRATDPALVSVQAHSAMISAVAITRDARWLASGDMKGAVAVFDGHTGAKVSDCVGGGQNIRALEFASDGSELYVVDSANHLRVFDTRTGRCVRERARRSLRETITLGDQARSIFCNADPGRYVDIDPTSLAERFVRELHVGDDWPSGSVVVDGDRVAGPVSFGGLGLWSLQRGRRDRHVVGGPGPNITAQPGLRRIAAWGPEAPIVYWDTEESALRLLDSATHRVGCVRITPDGKHLVAGCLEGEVLVYELSRSRLLRSLHGQSEVTALAAADHGIVLAGARDGRLRVMSVLLDPHVIDLQGVGWGTSLAADGDRLMAGGRDAVARCFDVPAGEPLWQVKLPHWVNGITLAADGLLVASFHGELRLIDRQTGSERRAISVDGANGYARRIAADGPGRRVAWLAESGALTIVDLGTGASLPTEVVATGRDEPFGALEWDRQGDVVLAAGCEPGVVVIDPDTGKVRARWQTDSLVVALCAEGEVFWTSEWQRELRRSSLCRRSLIDGGLIHRRDVSVAGLHLARLDGRLIHARVDNYLAVHDVEDLELLLELPLPGGNPRNLIASATGDWVAVQCVPGDPRVLLGRRDASAESSLAGRRVLHSTARSLAAEALAPTLWPPIARRALEARADLDLELRAAALTALPPDSAWSLGDRGRWLSFATNAAAMVGPQLAQSRDALIEALANGTDHSLMARVVLARVQLRLGDFAAALATVRDIVGPDPSYRADILFVRSAAQFALGQRAEGEAALGQLRAIVAANELHHDARRFLRELELHWVNLPSK